MEEEQEKAPEQDIDLSEQPAQPVNQQAPGQPEEATEPVNPYPPGQPIEDAEPMPRMDPTPVEEIPADQLASDGDAVVEGLPEEGSESPSAEG